MFKRYERAQKWLHEQNPDNQKHVEESSDSELPSMEELRREANENMELEKGDWFAMLVAAFFNILLPCLLFLLLIVGVAFLVF